MSWAIDVKCSCAAMLFGESAAVAANIPVNTKLLRKIRKLIGFASCVERSITDYSQDISLPGLDDKTLYDLYSKFMRCHRATAQPEPDGMWLANRSGEILSPNIPPCLRQIAIKGCPLPHFENIA
jgi:hypothetical protein